MTLQKIVAEGRVEYADEDQLSWEFYRGSMFALDGASDHIRNEIWARHDIGDEFEFVAHEDGSYNLYPAEQEADQ